VIVPLPKLTGTKDEFLVWRIERFLAQRDNKTATVVGSKRWIAEGSLIIAGDLF